jgi:ribosomal protein L24
MAATKVERVNVRKDNKTSPLLFTLEGGGVSAAAPVQPHAVRFSRLNSKTDNRFPLYHKTRRLQRFSFRRPNVRIRAEPVRQPVQKLI